MTIESINPSNCLAQLAANYSGAYLLLQGYPATGFARLNRDGLEMSPTLASHRKGEFGVDWDLFSDFRLFNQDAEYHAWRLGNGEWKGRLRRCNEARHTLLRSYPLWGTRTDGEHDGWVLRSEQRGASVWIPKQFDLPRCRPALAVTQILEQDEETYLFGVVDATINGFITVEVRDE